MRTKASWKKGESGNLDGRPRKSSSKMRDILEMEIDDNMLNVLLQLDYIKNLNIPSEMIKKWPLERLMDFIAILGSIGGGPNSYSFYKEIKERTYGKVTEERSAEVKPVTKKKNAKPEQVQKDLAEIFTILEEIRPNGVNEIISDLQPDPEQIPARSDAEIRELLDGASSETKNFPDA